MSQHESDILAAIDLGSNSFHMIIARVLEDGQLQQIDKIKDMVRLGGGLDKDNNLSQDSMDRAIETLARFGERLKEVPSASVRAVGTNTLRKAKGAKDFLRDAEDALGHPIEIISGREEGRLIYVGVAHGIFDPKGRKRLVVDIGGGSTEVIIGQEFEVLEVESHYMGCVSFSKRFFSDGKLNKKSFTKATLAARQELVRIATTFPRVGWEEALGASGTIKAIQSMLVEEGLGSLGITLPAMYRLRDAMIDQGEIDKLANIKGLKSERVPVIAGGLAILIGVFEGLDIDSMKVSEMALREGVLYDLHGRMSEKDVRDITISSMATRYAVDRDHAERVCRSAEEIWNQVKGDWKIDASFFAVRLRWACQIHEIGLSISHSRYHKHGSYLLENSDMPGFSKQDQQLLWALVRSHRRRFKPHRFDGQPGNLPTKLRRLCVILRLAVLLNRSRTEDALPDGFKIKVEGARIILSANEGWLENSPLTMEDLILEQDYLSTAGFELVLPLSEGKP